MAAEHLSAAQRRAIPSREFAGPHRSFPVRSAHEVKAAIRLAGHAANPDAVRARVKQLAKEQGLSGALPKTAHTDKAAKGSTRSSLRRGNGIMQMRVGR